MVPIYFDGRDRELHLVGTDVYAIDHGDGYVLEPDRARRLLRKAFDGSPIERSFAAAWFMRFGSFPRSQVCIQRYRVDFLLSGILVVELDGHDWHSNQFQRTKDAKRDRDLMRLGFRVIRFTGSEVKANPDACVEEAAALAGLI
jgi:very-short-patch-repair endonuclease